jgi:hypothetical protein
MMTTFELATSTDNKAELITVVLIKLNNRTFYKCTPKEKIRRSKTAHGTVIDGESNSLSITVEFSIGGFLGFMVELCEISHPGAWLG